MPLLQGFTIVELLVVLAVTFVLVLFLNQIFSSMSSGLAAGKATSDIINSVSVMSRQLQSDVETMVPPIDQRGFLVIVQKEYRNTVTGRNNYDNKTKNLYLRMTHDDPPDMPASQPVRIRSDQLVFLRRASGITPRTPRTATLYTDAVSGADSVRIWYGHASLTDRNGLAMISPPVPINLPGGPENFPASRWVLGRSAMFMDDAVSPSDIHIDHSSNRVVNTDAPYPAWYAGLSDIIDGAASKLFPPAGVGSYPDYPRRVYYYSFLESRLWCNPNPTAGSSGPPKPWQLAQAHSVLLENVSDFRVDFAGDYDGDVTTPVDLNGDGRIRWYGMKYREYLDDNSEPEDYNDTVLKSIPPSIKTRPDSLDAELGLVFHSQGVNPDSFPSTDNADGIFLWGPMSPVSIWPKMVRIRYRIHDVGNRLADVDDLHGKFFEHVVRIIDLYNSIPLH